MGLRRLPLLIDSGLYKRLQEAAKAEDRDPVQQAKVIIRRALADCEQLATPKSES